MLSDNICNIFKQLIIQLRKDYFFKVLYYLDLKLDFAKFLTNGSRVELTNFEI